MMEAGEALCGVLDKRTLARPRGPASKQYI